MMGIINFGITKRAYASLITLMVLVFTLVSGVSATSISQGYKTDDTALTAGMAVSLVSGQEDGRVTGATITNSDNFVGVITTVDENLISVRDQSSDVLVVTSGEALVYVSDISGEVKAGDVVGLSPIKGVLATAQSASRAVVVGVALEDMPQESAETKTVTTQGGATKDITVAKMRIKLGRDTATVVQDEQQNDSFLILAGESLTGKTVSQAQVIAALVVLLVILIVEGSIIYGAIHSTITSLGRNPLSRKAVFKQLLQVSWLALLVLVFGFGAIFLLLWI